MRPTAPRSSWGPKSACLVLAVLAEQVVDNGHAYRLRPNANLGPEADSAETRAIAHYTCQLEGRTESERL